MPRTKKVELDGASFTIAPLTVSQVEDFVQSQRDLLTKNDAPGMRDTWRDLICMGLNNAGAEYTKAALDDTLDLVLFNLLRDEILKFSGLRTEVEEKKIPEVAAAAAS
jgi:hypothetical protein